MPENQTPGSPDIQPIDLEAWSAEKPQAAAPECRHGYRIRIDKQRHVVRRPELTGRQLLVLAGKNPPGQHRLMLKLHGGQSRPVGLDETVSFRAPGVERFITIPLDPTDGAR